MSSNNENKQYIREFIALAYSDATELTRNLDAKAGAVFLLHGAMLSIVLATRENLLYAITKIFDFSLCCGILFVGLLIATFVLVLTSTVYLMYVIKPRRKLSAAVENELANDKRQMWYMPNSDKDKNKIRTNLENYYNNLISQDEDDIIKIEAYELLKVSFVRNKKMKSFYKAFACFMWSLLTMVVVAVITTVVNIV